jgi:Cd2+/Zn2+-exporting ATPase
LTAQATRTPALLRAQVACVSCALGVRSFTRRYGDFLRDPGTVCTVVAFVLLVLGGIQHPSGLLGSGRAAEVRTPFYIASALVGSVYIWWSAIQGIRERDFTADIPVSLATIAAIAIGQFSAAAIVAVLLLVGGMLEDFVAARAGNALDALARLLPDRVTVRRDGQEVQIATAELGAGDLVLVRSGERIAVDGEVLAGSAAINQAAITGESSPVDRTVGDEVYAGTLNELGAIEVRAARVGAETALGQIRRMVEEAQTQKAPIERLLDRYAKLYTPAALLLGAGVWLFTGDILRAITILIVFCPCVMVLATPTALVASIGNAALRGSLVKRGATIEALARIDTIAFDKTGTLTTGAPVLVEARSLNGMVDGELLRVVAAAERFSEHPVGRAIVASAEEKGLAVVDPERFEVLPGLGVRARVVGRDVLLGRPRLLVQEGVAVPAAVASEAGKLAVLGRTVILGSVDGVVEGMLVLDDSVRPEARQLTDRLARLGTRVALVTGDNQGTARRIADELGIEEVHAEVLPGQKVEVVKGLQAQGRRVAFVGDGVNDGPALAAADVGVAMGLGGTDVAIEAAEIALLSDDLSRLPHLLELSRQAIRAIKQNLVFSLGVLGIAVGLAIPGILHPVTGTLLHELSSLPVIANSDRLIGLRERT